MVQPAWSVPTPLPAMIPVGTLVFGGLNDGLAKIPVWKMSFLRLWFRPLGAFRPGFLLEAMVQSAWSVPTRLPAMIPVGTLVFGGLNDIPVMNF